MSTGDLGSALGTQNEGPPGDDESVPGAKRKGPCAPSIPFILSFPRAARARAAQLGGARMCTSAPARRRALVCSGERSSRWCSVEHQSHVFTSQGATSWRSGLRVPSPWPPTTPSSSCASSAGLQCRIAISRAVDRTPPGPMPSRRPPPCTLSSCTRDSAQSCALHARSSGSSSASSPSSSAAHAAPRWAAGCGEAMLPLLPAVGGGRAGGRVVAPPPRTAPGKEDVSTDPKEDASTDGPAATRPEALAPASRSKRTTVSVSTLPTCPSTRRSGSHATARGCPPPSSARTWTPALSNSRTTAKFERAHAARRGRTPGAPGCPGARSGSARAARRALTHATEPETHAAARGVSVCLGSLRRQLRGWAVCREAGADDS
mmetsp:Transcript_4964/g.14400  ORF Transcript_4964/g.14400 Transcript_4964/m.14400 type:complete len:376 (-) Transcript_4964:456-1583(-)